VSAFGAYTWDAGLLLSHAIPVALKVAQPGTREFRVALREAIEGTRDLPVSNGVMNMSKIAVPHERPLTGTRSCGSGSPKRP